MEDFYWDFYFHSLPPIQTLAHLYSVLLPVQLPCYANRSVTIIFVHRLSQSPGRLSGDYGKQPLPMTVNSLGLSQHVHNTQTPSCWEQWLLLWAHGLHLLFFPVWPVYSIDVCLDWLPSIPPPPPKKKLRVSERGLCIAQGRLRSRFSLDRSSLIFSGFPK